MGILMKNGVNYTGGLIEVKPEIYSEEEREIGVWTDGKPLYEKTIVKEDIQLTTDSSYIKTASFSYSELGLSNIDNIFVVTAFEIRSTGTVVRLNYSDASNEHTYSFLHIRPQSTNVFYQTNINSSDISKLVFTLRYTKTTDTAGSGLWSTTGAPNRHYSTSEQVVGTWIDGKPLYEKTFTGTFTVTTTSRKWYNIYSANDISSLHIDKCMFIQGIYKEPSQSFYVDMGVMKGNDGIYATMAYNPNEGINFVVCNGATGTAEFIFTIRYTKTTD